MIRSSRAQPMATRGLRFRLQLDCEDDYWRVECTSTGAPPTSASLPLGAGELASFEWDTRAFSATASTYADLLQELRTSPIAKRLPALEAEWLPLAADAEAGREPFGSSVGSGGLRLGDDGVELSWRARGTERAVADSNAMAELMARLPDAVELWVGSALHSFPEALLAGLANVIDRAINRALLRDLEEGETGALEPPASVAPVARMHEALAPSRAQFLPGFAVITTTDGGVGPAESRRRPAPAFAILSRPRSTNSGLWFARQLLTPLTEFDGIELRLGDERIDVILPDGAGPDLQPHAVMLGEILVISTSERLTNRLIQGGSRSWPEDRRFCLQTTGARIGDLLDTVTQLLTHGRRTPKREVGVAACRAAGSLLRLLGHVEIRSEAGGEHAETRVRVAFASAETTTRDAVLTRARAARGQIAAEHMLVARGNGTYGGRPTTFEFAYAADGRFRQRVFGPLGLDSLYDGVSSFQDTGWGWVETGPSELAFSVGWGAGVGGAFLVPDALAGVEVAEVTDQHVVLELLIDGAVYRPRIGIDRETWLPRWVDPVQPRPPSQSRPTRLSDLRRVGDLVLPHEIVVDDSEDASSTRYHVDTWRLAPIDGRFTLPEQLAGPWFAPDAEPLELTPRGDVLWCEGRIGDQQGWFLLTPLLELSWLDGPLFDALVIAGAPQSGNGRALEARDVQCGPLRAARGVFDRLDQPVPEAPNGSRVLGYLGSTMLAGACITFNLQSHALRIEPPGSFDGDGWADMQSIATHRVFAAGLPGGVRTWAAPVTSKSATVWIKPLEQVRLAALSRGADGPLHNGALRWVQFGALRIEPQQTVLIDRLTPWADDPTPLVVSFALLQGQILEMDFPNGRYRLVPAPE